MRRPIRAECLYIDFDSYFASAEQLLEPRLRGLPVGIVPVLSHATCLIAASKEAKVFGLKTGTMVKDAKRICPQLILRQARADQYVKLHHQILQVIEGCVPIAGVRSIDEMVCHLMVNESLEGYGLVQRIKRALAAQIGETLTCSIGLAPNELLAKIAAEMNKPDGYKLILPDDLPHALYGLKLTDVPGIGRGNLFKLLHCGVRDMRGLLAISLAQARRVFGGVEGARLVAALNGYVVERPATHKGMFGHSRILAWEMRDAPQALIMARLLTIKAARRMRRECYHAKGFSLAVRFENGWRWYGEAQVFAANDDHTFLQNLAGLFHQAMFLYGQSRIKKISVVLFDLVQEQAVEPDLFEFGVRDEKVQKWEKVSKTIDVIREKFGDHSLYLGQNMMPKSEYAGAKIAFNRVPDMRDFDL